MHSILIDGKVILTALQAEKASDVDLLWQVLQSGVKGYITQADLDLLFVNITRSQGLDSATQVIHHLQKTLIVVPEQLPKFDYHITSQYSTFDPQNNATPAVSVSEYLERLSLDLIYHHQPSLSQKPRKALMQWYQKAAGLGFDPLLIIPFAMTLLLQSLGAFDKAWGIELSQSSQKDEQTGEDDPDKTEDSIENESIENNPNKQKELTETLVVKDSANLNKNEWTIADFISITIKHDSLPDKKKILMISAYNYFIPKPEEKKPDGDNKEIIASVLEQPLSFDSSLVPDLQNNQELLPAIWVNVIAGTNGSDQLGGGSQDDYLRGLDGDDKLMGSFGNDTLDGGSGNDLLIGGQGNDILSGFSGKDLILGGAGHDLLLGGQDSDTLQGGSGDDLVKGQEGDDLLIGNSGNDILVGGLGNDSLHGGLGNDVFVLERDAGVDKVYDYEVGKDLFALPKGLELSDLSFTQEIQGVAIKADTNQPIAVAVGVTTAEISDPSNWVVVKTQTPLSPVDVRRSARSLKPRSSGFGLLGRAVEPLSLGQSPAPLPEQARGLKSSRWFAVPSPLVGEGIEALT